MTSAQKQAAWRQRQKANAAELDSLRAEVARLEAELAEAQTVRRAPRCDRCRTELACPACNRGDDF